MPRLTRVELVLGAALDEVTEANLQRLVDESISETEDLDYKAGVYWIGGGKQELAKDVAALANHIGGLLIVGIDEDGNARAKAPTPQPITDAQERTIQEVVADYVHPAPTVHSRQVDGIEGRYLLIAVPRSAHAPHAVQVPGTDYLRYPVRSGTSTRWLTETEVADRYRSRFRESATTVDIAERRAGEVPTSLNLLQAWLLVSVVPEVPGRYEVNAAGGRNLADWLRSMNATGIEEDALIHDLPGARFAPGRYLFRFDRDGKSDSYHIEMFADGGCVIAVDIGDNPDGGMHVIAEVRLARAMVAVLGLAAHYAVDIAGATGTAVAVAEIVEPHRGGSGHRDHSMILKAARPAGSGGLHAYQRVPGSSAPFSIPATRHVIEVGSVRDSWTERLATAHLLLRDLVQGFGLAEPVHLTADGKIRTAYFHPAPTAWAASVGVEVDAARV